MNIHAYLKERRGLIDRTLNRYLVERGSHPKKLFKAMRYSVFSGGKRIRPILTLAVGELFGAKQSALLPFACALELIHTYSLIHDDLPALDNDDLRRGQPTSHKVFGEGIALLAGDALLTEAFDLIARLKTVRVLKPEVVLDLMHELARAAGIDGMVGGQSIDLDAVSEMMTTGAVENIHLRKTGSLILVAARLGAIIGGATPKELRRINRYGESLGLAFQIADDILDEESNSTEATKTKTTTEGSRATYPSIAGLAAAKARAEELLQRCLVELKSFSDKAEPLREIARFVVARAVCGVDESPVST